MLYAVIRRLSDGYVWNGSAFAAWSDGSLSSYAITLTAKGGDLFTADVPNGITRGTYEAFYYERAGASPATTDLLLQRQSIYVDGALPTTDNETYWTNRVTAIRDALAASPAGVVSVSIDGQTTNWNRADLRAELDWSEKKLAQAKGTRRVARSINLSSGWNE